MKVPTHLSLEDLDMADATSGAGLACADVTTFCRLDELGLEVTGQRLEPDRAVGFQTDTKTVTIVEKTTYSVAQNEVGRRRDHDTRGTLGQSSAHGAGRGIREKERTNALRSQTSGRRSRGSLLVGSQSHGGEGVEGAVRFQLVHADRSSGAVLTPNSVYAARTVPPFGNINEHLRYSTFVTWVTSR